MPKKKLLIIFNKYKEFGGEQASYENEKEFLKNDYTIKSLEFSNDNLLNLIFSPFNPIAFFKTIYEILIFKPEIIYFNNLWFGASNSPIVASFFARKAIKKIKLHNFRLSCSKADHFLNSDTCTRCSISNKKDSYKLKCYKNSLVATYLVNVYSNFQAKLIKSKLIDEVLVLNNLQKEYLTNFGIKQEKVKVVKNIIKIRSSIKTNFNENQNRHFLFIGRLEEEKGLIDLLDVWETVNTTNENLKIIGDGSLRSYVVEYVKKSNNVEYLGFVDNNLIVNKIAESKCVIFPTRLFEGQPTVIIESMKMGIPVISSNISFFDTFDTKGYVSTYKLGNRDSLQLLIENYFDNNFYIKQKNNWKLFSQEFFNKI